MRKISFRKFEHKILPQFRRRINEAESTEDVTKAFLHSIIAFSDSAFEGRVPIGSDEVSFRPYRQPYFLLDRQLFEDSYFRSVWKDSDLRHVFERLAESAMNRYRHLEKHREKRDAKIRMKVGL